MKRIKIIIVVLILHSTLFTLHLAAQQLLLDHDWYLAGEKMTVAFEAAKGETTSTVAYVELCDVAGIQADAIIALNGGRGQGCLWLPKTLHSGNYLLSVYTRMGKTALQKMVPVINTLQKSVADDISWVDTEGQSKVTTPSTLMTTSLPQSYLNTFGQRQENEGHCIYARVRKPVAAQDYDLSNIESTLSVVGKEVHVFPGKKLNDSTVVFNAYDVNGSHSIVIEAETDEAKPLQVELLSPFATLLPKELPHLTFDYNRQEVENRSIQMQLNVNDTMVVDSTVFSDMVFSMKPVVSYNLDEYRQFRTVKDVLLEYVNFVHRKERFGRSQLYVSTTEEGYGEWPALVLLDGMPVQDVDRLLKYDARRVYYISIYNDFYAFGNIRYKGIVNIVTRTGKLTNFPPEPTSAYLIYNFPQK